MKCRKCGFTNPDYLENCRKCQSDLTETRSLLGLSPVKPEKVCFLSRLLPHADSAEMKGAAEELLSESAQHKMAEPVIEAVSAEPPDSLAFNLPQLDFSGLLDGKPDYEQIQTESTHDVTASKDTGFPDLDLVTLDLESELNETSPHADTKSAENSPAHSKDLPFDLDDQTSLELLLGGMPQDEKGTADNSLEEIKMDKEDDTKPPAPPAGSRSAAKGRGRRKPKSSQAPENPGINLYFKNAGLGQRLLAFCFDWCILMIVTCSFVLGTVAAGKIALETANSLDLYSAVELTKAFLLPLQFCILAVITGYYVFFHGYTGQTPGKMILGIKVIHSSGLPLGFGQAFLRWTGLLLGILPLNLGLIWAATNKKRQGWHDKITDTVVIRLR